MKQRSPWFSDARQWFEKRRLGLFLHWGLYAIEGCHEQQQWRYHVDRNQYQKLIKKWNPTRFDPDAWLDIAERAGMEYLCFTTKHHDGFCLWDTKLTSFNTMNSAYGKDILAMLAEACHRRHMPLCLYYSVVDWHQPNYPNQGRHHELPAQSEDDPNWNQYVACLKGQVHELCTNYGEIHGFWWDMNVPEAVDHSVNAIIRKHQPAAVINNRGFDQGDFSTPERDFDNDANRCAFTRPTEACQSVGSESWGYRERENYFTDRYLMQRIDHYLARGANYLLNIGPHADGTIGDIERGMLERIGAWYRGTRESFVDVEFAVRLTSNQEVLLTRRGNVVYVHLDNDPISSGVKLPPIDVMPTRATLLNDGRPVTCEVSLLPSEHLTGKPCLWLRGLPTNELANTALVIKLEFETLPETLPDTLGITTRADDCDTQVDREIHADDTRLR